MICFLLMDVNFFSYFLPLRQDPAWDERPGLRQTLDRTSCLRIFIIQYSIFISSANINIPYSSCLPMLLLLLLLLITSCLPIFKFTNVPIILRSEISSLVHLSMQNSFPNHGMGGKVSMQNSSSYQFLPQSFPYLPSTTYCCYVSLEAVGGKLHLRRLLFLFDKFSSCVINRRRFNNIPMWPTNPDFRLLSTRAKGLFWFPV